MFKTIKRVINWCGEFKGKLYIGFVFSFFSTWFAPLPVMVAAYTVGLLIDESRSLAQFDDNLIWQSLVLIMVLVFLRFLFDYLRARFQESISYHLVARDRLAIGNILKRVSLGYFQKVNTGEILNSITTGLHTLENMGIRMINTFVDGYLQYLCILICIAVFNPMVALITVAGPVVSFLFLLIISKCSKQNAPIAMAANRDLTNASIEYARGLPVVKSFGQGGATFSAMKKACADSKSIHLKFELGFLPANCLHLLALKTASVGMLFASFYLGITGEMSLPVMLSFCFFSFGFFAGIEPISDSAHVLSVIKDAMNQLDHMKSEEFIDESGKEIPLSSMILFLKM